jgi:Zn-dependent protease
MNSGMALGRVFGTEIRAHWTWIIVLALITWYFGAGLSTQTDLGFDSAWGWGSSIACAVLVFFSVTVHELAHVWLARRYGIGGNVVVVQLLGGTYLTETRPHNPGQEFRSSVAGPVLSLIVMLVFIAVVAITQFGWDALQAGEKGAAAVPTGIVAVSFVAQVLALFNLFLAATNLIPAYPMDGARIIHAAAWRRSGREDVALAVSSRVGRMVGMAIIFLGATVSVVVDLMPGLTLVIAGWLLVGSSRMLDRRAMLQDLMAGAHVSDAAETDPARIPPQLTLDVFAGDYLGERLGGAALVERGNELLGLIGTAQIRKIPRRNWTVMRTEQAMVPLGNVPWAAGDAELWPVLELLERSGLDALLIGTGGQSQVSALLTRRSAAQLIRERAEARARILQPGLAALRVPGRRFGQPPPPPPLAEDPGADGDATAGDATAGDAGSKADDQPNDERKDQPKDG